MPKMFDYVPLLQGFFTFQVDAWTFAKYIFHLIILSKNYRAKKERQKERDSSSLLTSLNVN